MPWSEPDVFQKGKVVPSHASVHPLWQKISCHKGLVLLKNESSCLNEPRTNCFSLKAIPSSPNPRTRLFFKVTWKALKAHYSGGAISVECRGDVFSLDVVGLSLLLQCAHSCLLGLSEGKKCKKPKLNQMTIRPSLSGHL